MNSEDLNNILGGKGINVGKCVTGTASGVISGALALGKLGWQASAAGAVIGGGMAAWKSCR
ncbi:MAG: hypothetical protein ACI319_10765 [Holdemanella porci]